MYTELSIAERMQYDSLSNNLAKLRNIYNYTWAELSKTLGVQMSHIYKWETGENRIVPAKAFVLAALFETSVNELMGIPDAKELQSLRDDRLAPPDYWEPDIDTSYLSLSIKEKCKYKFPARNLRSLRTCQELTVREVSQRFGISSSCYTAWELGASTPNLGQAFALAATFGITINQLFGVPADDALKKCIFSNNVTPLPQAKKGTNEEHDPFIVTAISQAWAGALPKSATENMKEKLIARYEYEDSTLVVPPSSLTPEPEVLFRALHLTPPDKVKAVIMTTGFERFYYKNSDWLALSNSSIKPELYRNLLDMTMRTYSDDLGLPAPPCGDLTPWAKQGVLLFPMMPLGRTKEYNTPISRLERFSEDIVRYLSASSQPVVFIFVGSKVATRMSRLVNMTSGTNYVIKWNVPRRDSDYVNSGMFTEANRALTGMGGEPIDWNLSDARN